MKNAPNFARPEIHITANLETVFQILIKPERRALKRIA